MLVGPDFSDGLLTGAQSQAIVGTDDITYNVLSIKVENQPVIIISSQAFIPKVSIKGFRTGINPGMNIADEAIVGRSFSFFHKELILELDYPHNPHHSIY